MAHGTQDWWGTEPSTTVHAVQDAGELAVRLQSSAIYDRRGRVVMIEDFLHGYKTWALSGSGTGAGGNITHDTSQSGAYSLKLIGGSDVGWLAEAYRWVPTYVLGRVGLAVSFAADSDLDRFEIHLDVRDGTNLYQAALRWDHVNGNVDYLDNGAAWQTIDADKDLVSGLKHWHSMKLVVDAGTGKYARGLVNEDEYDLSAYSLQSAAVGEPTYIMADFYCYSKDTKNAECCIDDVIVTVDEP